MANRRTVPLSPKQAAARLNIAVADLPRTGSWQRQEVKDLREARPEWLTVARGSYDSRQDAKAEHERAERVAWLAQQPLHECFCCKAEFGFTVDSSGMSTTAHLLATVVTCCVLTALC